MEIIEQRLALIFFFHSSSSAFSSRKIPFTSSEASSKHENCRFKFIRRQLKVELCLNSLWIAINSNEIHDKTHWQPQKLPKASSMKTSPTSHEFEKLFSETWPQTLSHSDSREFHLKRRHLNVVHSDFWWSFCRFCLRLLQFYRLHCYLFPFFFPPLVSILTVSFDEWFFPFSIRIQSSYRENIYDHLLVKRSIAIAGCVTLSFRWITNWSFIDNRTKRARAKRVT